MTDRRHAIISGSRTRITGTDPTPSSEVHRGPTRKVGRHKNSRAKRKNSPKTNAFMFEVGCRSLAMRSDHQLRFARPPHQTITTSLRRRSFGHHKRGLPEQIGSINTAADDPGVPLRNQTPRNGPTSIPIVQERRKVHAKPPPARVGRVCRRRDQPLTTTTDESGRRRNALGRAEFHR